ncbi:hypothetical protein NQ317_014024 [Molorchus minor]|uniref:THAP-type domain-containing protein n=1 Tax=Molorchus minor TaxID=1323400 RepID=A0ABQ9J4S9_9CUCU|nr:hypothetical protein NQ317_014024 [Molorchus minor]
MNHNVTKGGCKNTSKNAPKKLFVTVPRQMPRKIKWFKAARRDLPKTKAIFFCCEDHFNNQMHTYFAAFEPLTSAILNLLSRFINSATIKTSTAVYCKCKYTTKKAFSNGVKKVKISQRKGQF